MIYHDEKIEIWAIQGGIDTKSLKIELINPASLDLITGNALRRTKWYWRNFITRLLMWYYYILFDPSKLEHNSENANMYWTDPIIFQKYTLWPNELILLHSEEIVDMPKNAVGFLLSKSSTGRKGLEHLHAGYFDPAFRGQATFEVFNASRWPIVIKAGQPLMQLVLASTESTPNKLYTETGRYQNQMGAQSARESK